MIDSQSVMGEASAWRIDTHDQLIVINSQVSSCLEVHPAWSLQFWSSKSEAIDWCPLAPSCIGFSFTPSAAQTQLPSCIGFSFTPSAAQTQLPSCIGFRSLAVTTRLKVGQPIRESGPLYDASGCHADHSHCIVQWEWLAYHKWSGTGCVNSGNEVSLTMFDLGSWLEWNNKLACSYTPSPGVGGTGRCTMGEGVCMWRVRKCVCSVWVCVWRVWKNL